MCSSVWGVVYVSFCNLVVKIGIIRKETGAGGKLRLTSDLESGLCELAFYPLFFICLLACLFCFFLQSIIQ